MSDQLSSADGQGEASFAASPLAGASSSVAGLQQDMAARVQERPELAVGGAFAGGLILALVLKRLAG